MFKWQLGEACCRTLSFALVWFTCVTAGSEYKHNFDQYLTALCMHNRSLLGILAMIFEAIVRCLCCGTIT